MTSVSLSSSSSSRVADSWRKEALREEFYKLPEHSWGVVEEALDTNPRHPLGSYFLFRSDGPTLEIARIIDYCKSQVAFDSFSFDEKKGIFQYEYSQIWIQNQSDGGGWVRFFAPSFLDRKKQWDCLGALRHVYGHEQEIACRTDRDWVAEALRMHDELSDGKEPCLYDEDSFETDAELYASLKADLLRAPSGTFTILGRKSRPNKYRLCYTDEKKTIHMKQLQLTADLAYQTHDRLFGSIQQLRSWCRFGAPISTERPKESSSL